MRFLDLCHGPIASDQSLLDFPCVESSMYSIKFTSLKIVDATQYFCVIRMIKKYIRNTEKLQDIFNKT